MKIIIAVACLALISLAQANEVRIQDVKVITPEGSFEEVKKEELEDGNVIKSETISVKKPNIEKKHDDESLVSSRIEDLAKKRQLLSLYLTHLKMANVIRNVLINSAPEEKIIPKTRVFVFKLPLGGSPPPLFPFPRMPAYNFSNTTCQSQCSSQTGHWNKISSSEPKEESNLTPIPPVEDQIPTPVVVNSSEKPMTE